MFNSAPVVENLRRIQDRVGAAAISAGRKPEDVTLVAVSKTAPAEAVIAALEAGQPEFGENSGKRPRILSDYAPITL